MRTMGTKLSTMQYDLGKATTGHIRESHMDYMRLSQGRWTQMLAIIRQISSSTGHQVVKSPASLATKYVILPLSGQCSNTLLGENVVTSSGSSRTRVPNTNS